MMTYSTLRILSLLSRMAGSILFVLACIPISGLHPWIPLFFSLLLLGVSARMDYRYWRCPYCHRHLGKRMVPFPPVCPHCKKTLHQTDKVPTKSAFRAYQKTLLGTRSSAAEEEKEKEEAQ